MGKTVFVDLTHPFSAEIPRWPYFDKPVIDNTHTMAKGGVLTQKITCTMHTGTHCDAPRHVMEYEFDGRRARYTHEMPVDAYTGTAVVLKIDIEPWGLITDKHLDEACKRQRTHWQGLRQDRGFSRNDQDPASAHNSQPSRQTGIRLSLPTADSGSHGSLQG